MAANEQRSLPLSCRTHPLCLALRRPRIADGFGGQDQAPPDCGSVTPERVEPVLGTPYTSLCKFRGLHAYLRGGTSSSPSDGAAGRDEVVLKGPRKDPLLAAPRLRHTLPCSLGLSVLLAITRSRIRPEWERATTKHTKKGNPAC